MTEVRAITVHAPWSRCIASTDPAAKRIENRGAGTDHRGMLLIHEGQKVDVAAYADPRVVGLLDPNPDAYTMPGAGAVIAVANLVDAHGRALTGCCRPWGENWHHGPRSNRWAVHLVLADVRPLARPVPCRGALGLWTPPADVIAAVNAQLAEAGAR